jgi:hypothetical protein
MSFGSTMNETTMQLKRNFECLEIYTFIHIRIVS